MYGFFLFLFLLLSSPESFARWAGKNEATHEIQFRNVTWNINADGTYSVTTEKQVKILKDPAKDSEGNFEITYDTNSTTVTVLEAKTKIGSREYYVDASLIQDKPLASGVQAFDEQNKLTVIFPNVEIGSELYIKYVYRKSHVPIPGFFSNAFYFGWHELLNSNDIKIESKIPLYIDINDPDKVLDISERTEEGKYFLSIKLNKPAYYYVADEKGAFLDRARTAWMDISSLKKWDANILKTIFAGYENVFTAPMPNFLEKPVATAKEKKDPIDQINILTEFIQKEFRYMGDWRSVDGGHIPRKLETIVATRFGDCKDASALLVTMLRKLGYKAHVAWIERDASYIAYQMKFAMDVYNHAIVYAELNGKEFWIDPTNYVSFAQGIFDDIADRPALILDPSNPRIKQTVKPKAEDKVSLADVIIRPQIGDKNQVSVILKKTGSAASSYSGMALRESIESIDYSLIGEIADDRNKVLSYKVEKYDLTSRIVSDLEFRYSYEELSSRYHSSAGDIYTLWDYGPFDAFYVNVSDRVSDIYISQPRITKNKYKIKNIIKNGNVPLDCKIKSPWIDADRKIKVEGKDVVVTDTYKLKVTYISYRDFINRDFLKMRDQLQRCFRNVGLAYRLRNEAR